MAGASGAVEKSLMTVALAVFFFQAVYWVAYGVSSRVSSTWKHLSDAKGEKGYFAASIVSNVHAIIITPWSLYVLITDPFLLSSGGWVRTTEGSQLACTIFLGYMLSESLVALYYNTRWAGWEQYLAHHVMVSVTWFLIVCRGYGQGLALILHAMEITAPFVNARWFLDKAGKKKSKVYLVNGLAMTLCFFLCRILGYVFACVVLLAQWRSLTEANVHLIEKIIFVLCFLLGFVLQSFWFSKMARGAMRVLFPPRAPRATESHPGTNAMQECLTEATEQIA